MFGVDTTELLIVAVAALIFIGPKELPGAMRTVGRWVGRVRAHARHFTSGIESMMREAELEEMEKRWREENERIMREHPVALPYVGAAEGPNQQSFKPSDVDTRSTGKLPEVPSTSLRPNDDSSGEEEPPLPLPEPGHHRRELP